MLAHQYSIGRGAYSISSFAEAHSIGRTNVYEEIKKGRLRAVKVGKRTLILQRDAEEWANSLPLIGGAK